jgi:hypothetical protein
MVQETVPAAKRRLNAHFRELRRTRIFMRLREGRPHTEIAREEGVTDTRIRQIISETLKKRVGDAPTDYAVLQLMRLEPALRLAAEAVVSGDIKAVRYYLKLLDQLDSRQPAAAAPQAGDDAACERLNAKMSRTAVRLHARKVKQTPARPRSRTAAGDLVPEAGTGRESERSEPIDASQDSACSL